MNILLYLLSLFVKLLLSVSILFDFYLYSELQSYKINDIKKDKNKCIINTGIAVGVELNWNKAVSIKNYKYGYIIIFLLQKKLIILKLIPS